MEIAVQRLQAAPASFESAQMVRAFQRPAQLVADGVAQLMPDRVLGYTERHDGNGHLGAIVTTYFK